MNLIGKLQPLILIVCAALGLLLGKNAAFGKASAAFIEPFLMALLYVLFLGVDVRKILASFRNVRYTFTATAINFILTPVVAFLLGKIFFASSADIRLGLLMLLVTPCTDWYLVFTKLSKGNVELNVSILPWNLVLQVVLLPVYLLLFMGSEVSVGVWKLLGSVFLVLAIPFGLSVLTKILVWKVRTVKDFIQDQNDLLQLICLGLAVVAMFASESEDLFENVSLLFWLFVPLAIFFAQTFFISKGAGKFLRFSRADTVSLVFTTLARNSPLALAIASATFGDRPLVLLSLVIGPLIELPILFLISSILLGGNRARSASE